MTRDETRAVIYATARKMHVGEEWRLERRMYELAFSFRNGEKFDDPDFQLIDRTIFYLIRRIK